MTEPLIATVVPDIAGHVRGKAIPLAGFDAVWENGTGWTPANVQITCFDVAAKSPWGPTGDVRMIPAREAMVEVALPAGATERFVLCDVVEGDGAPWECCLRTILKTALAALKAETGLELRASFEHEFTFRDGDGPEPGSAYSLRGLRGRRVFGETLCGVLRDAGLPPDSFLREFGPRQFEITLPPQPALRAADEAVALRQLTYAVAEDFAAPVTFSPLVTETGVGNGVHIHFSFWDENGHPKTLDGKRPHGLSEVAGRFIAGILDHLPALTAITAPSALSHMRLTPHRWSAAFNNLGVQDREAAVRICPTFGADAGKRARQYNIEFRATDAAATPHLSLAAMIFAGLDGIRQARPAPEPTVGDLTLLSAEALAAKSLARLPASLDEALLALEADTALLAAFPGRFGAIYLDHKRGELGALEGKDIDERLAAYRAAY
ncbi:glutamine synthetase family protein [Acuticoccus sp. M5D2P5]|uniref:glutamine synthetase family protein n=1 Tax=Acuticoccus kalidii TaxID=2910977 RepID=UPI001F274B4F|nr:glutamine synthetase family protein [Acuticoccus kalidii]MCF3936746.1 glutamine synthetase family protein [Acuticoccus kalidii]